MKVAFQFPAAAEPHDTQFDKSNNTMTVEPKFFSQVTTAIGHVSVKGGAGTDRKFLIMISPTTGEPKFVAADQAVTPTFDTVTPEEFRKKQATMRGQAAHAVKTRKKDNKEQPPDGPPTPPTTPPGPPH